MGPPRSDDEDGASEGNVRLTAITGGEGETEEETPTEVASIPDEDPAGNNDDTCNDEPW